MESKNIKIIGNYKDYSNLSPIFSYKCPSKHLNDVWQRCGLLSNFFGQAIANLVKINDNNVNINSLKEIYSYLVNELLENMAKFGLHDNDNDCSFTFWKEDKSVLISEFSNFASLKNGNNFISIANELINSKDINALYIQKIEENALSDTETSGLGFFTLINDYSVKFTFKFEKMTDSYAITIQTLLNIKEI